MNITVIGTGYVGLVTGVCLSNVGNKVICFDIDENKIDMLNSGKVPIYEPELDQKMLSGVESSNLSFTCDHKIAVQNSDIIFITVGTPTLDNGDIDLSYVESAANMIGENLTNDKVIVMKSTVPVGTSSKVKNIIEEHINNRNLDFKIDLIFNPEFLKEGKAIRDFESPDRIVLGYEKEESLNILVDLYRPFNLHHDKIIKMDLKSAELTKYASNAFLATKISYINEIANVCEKVGANINSVRKGVCSDSRIGYDFLYPGVGFGGSCFPKDLQALKTFSRNAGYETSIVDSVIKVNYKQRHLFADKVIDFFEGKSDVCVAVWGLSFKPGTDDVREAPSIDIIKKLLDNNFSIRAYDPIAINNFNKVVNDERLSFADNLYDALDGADALLLLSEWSEFRSPDFNKVAQLMNQSVIFDGKNIYSQKDIVSKGFKHFQVGVKS